VRIKMASMLSIREIITWVTMIAGAVVIGTIIYLLINNILK